MSKELWQMEAERMGGPALAEMLGGLHELQLESSRKIDAIIERNVHADAAMAKLLAGFPSGDVDGHRRYHEAIIERMELRNRMVREALIKAAGSGALAGLGWLAYAVWQAFVANVHKGG
jgi:uncharacterized membrane protein YebE (DUF533 family)